MGPIRAMWAVAALMLLTASPALADMHGKKLGLGFGGGTIANGLTAKYYIGEDAAVQLMLGQRFSYGISVGVDYVMEFKPLAQGGAGRLFWGAGVGAGLLLYDVGSHDANIIGVSGIVELGWHFKALPLEVVVDWRPTFFIGDYLGGLWLRGGGGAIRWFF